MKQFKFRCWDQDLKRWLIPLELDKYNWLSWESPEESRGNVVWQQFTGLLDVNKKEIYTGDLVNFTLPAIPHGPDREDYTNQEVIFDKEIASFAFGEQSMTILSDNIEVESLEVVGNIFE